MKNRINTLFRPVAIIIAVAAFTLGQVGCSDPCKDQYCLNGGDCLDGDCVCPSDYYGEHCQYSYSSSGGSSSGGSSSGGSSSGGSSSGGSSSGGSSSGGSSSSSSGGSSSSSSGGSSSGDAVFWTAQDWSCGNITVTVNGSSRTISQYYTSGTADCGDSGCANFYSLSPGSYSFYAECGSYYWDGYINISAGGCSTMQLN